MDSRYVCQTSNVSLLGRFLRGSLVNSSGFSLTEALIGVGLITALAFVVAKFGSETSSNSNRPVDARTCEAVAQGVIDAVKNRGVYKQIYNLTPGPNGRSATGLFTMPLISNGNLWAGGAANYNVNNTTTDYGTNGDAQKEVSTAGYSLVDGYMRFLMALYNTNPGAGGFCSTWTNYPNFSVANLQLNTGLRLGNNPPQIDVQIKPYDIDTNDDDACPASVRVYPPGDPNISSFTNNPTGIPPTVAANQPVDGESSINIPTADYTGTYAFSSNNRGDGEGIGTFRQQLQNPAPSVMSGSNIGFKFHVRVSHTQNGVNTSCEASHNFQYYADTTAPSRPTVSITSNNTKAANYIVPGSNRTVVIEFRHNTAGENGIQLYCRDRSERLVYNYNDRAKRCFVGGAVAPEWTVGLPSDGSRTQIPYATVTQDWVPCDQVRACGRTPSSRLLTTGGALVPIGSEPYSGPPYIRNTYSIPPTEACDIIIDVVAIDPAGNRSDISTADQVRTAFNFTSATSASVVRRPRCIHANRVGTVSLSKRGIETEFGWYCHESNTSDFSNDWGGAYPNGYYTTRSNGCCYVAAPNTNPKTQGPTSCSPQ